MREMKHTTHTQNHRVVVIVTIIIIIKHIKADYNFLFLSTHSPRLFVVLTLKMKHRPDFSCITIFVVCVGDYLV